jgi:sterol 24-C-methyltransferase
LGNPRCRYYKGEAFYQAIARHEHYLSAQMGLKPGMKVLDVGCGVGGPAREIARFSGAHITGLNNNQFQVERATKYTARAGLSDQVDFVKADFMKLAEHFGPNSFDAVYAIEATVHAPNFEGIYSEIKKVLKPGGIVSGWTACRRCDPFPIFRQPVRLADTRAAIRLPCLASSTHVGYSSASTSGA